ncbi:MAG TPA: hypothetical protein VMZ27_05315 [Candidatus Saccharimonadales bacterium]|nr:hypothetical protein [Candidatus Saccharimonadales bacterium]
MRLKYFSELALPCLGLFLAFSLQSSEVCRIQVVEKGSGWPVPLIELRTTHHERFVSDNAGIIAFDLPEMMHHETWFDVIGHGYGIPRDGFGMRGVRLKPEPNKTLQVEVTRSNIAKRLGRLTGAGLFAESQKLGHELDWRESGIVGSDSVQNAVYQGKMFWAWGDTVVANYPLGIFDMTSATTDVQPFRSFEPPLRLQLKYFTDRHGTPRGVAPMPGSGPTWITGYTSLPDKTGRLRLVGTYRKIRSHLEVYQSGLCVWDDAKESFQQLKMLWTKSEDHPEQPPAPDGHPALFKDGEGKNWILFGNPLPILRCLATFEAWQDSVTWELLKPQTSFASASNGAPVKPHSGSIAWNEYRKRWVTVFVESGGKPSRVGEVWYAEAKTPLGPWGKALKVVTHDNYTFYNPRLHPEFTPQRSPILIFEGTYTEEFANRPEPTPRYNYNQILYRLDLDEAAFSVTRFE